MTRAGVERAIGIDVGGTKTAVGLVDVTTGEVIDAREVASEAERGAEALHRRIGPIVVGLVERHDARSAPVGVAVPELVSPSGEVMTEVVISGLGGDLRERWVDLGVGVVESDVRAAALAEAAFGLGADLPSFAYISVGTGISSCFVIDRRPWAGAHGAAILVGSGVVVDRDGGSEIDIMPPLESVAGGPGIVQRFRALGGTASTAREVVGLVDEDPAAREAVRSAGRTLGQGLAEIVNLLDPSAVIVGGGLGSAPGAYWEAAVGAARRAIWADVSRDVPLLQSGIGSRAALIGVAFQARGIA